MKRDQTAFLKLCLADALIKLMDTKDFSEINVNAICREANIGRTTFYRYFESKNSKEDLLIFKILYEWEQYAARHTGIQQEKDFGLTGYIYENRELFTKLYRSGLITVIMRAFEELIPAGEPQDKQSSYLLSFFTYGYFGIIYQWIKYDFDEPPEQIQQHITNTLAAGLRKKE